MNYVKAKGITTEAAYPYTGVEGTCKTNTGAYHITSYTMLAAGSTTALTAAIVKEPISICVDASNWSSYSSGIYPASQCSSSAGSLDHAVLAVGYTGTYWLVKNSWGTSWGMAGYIELARPGNTCGLADHAISVTH